MTHELVSTTVEIPVKDSISPLRAYLAYPVTPGKYPGILTGMELFGVTDHIRDIANRIAAKTGFPGFRMGGHIAYFAATQLTIAANACFYGGLLANTGIPLSQPEPTVTLTPGIAQHGGKLMYFTEDKTHILRLPKWRKSSRPCLLPMYGMK
jgi:dienelactone hydrolase